MVDALTRSWIRNEADARAAASGCRFDLDRAVYAAWWIERFCRLYEGEWAGEPLVLRGAHSMPLAAVEEDFYTTAGDYGTGHKLSIARANDYMGCVAAGEPCDWQYECVMRIFGWARTSKRWKREVRRFNRGGVWVPKKNKKSPTLAAVSLYLLAGDGEPGAKVFLGAKDSTQIRKNVSLHILEMVNQSPELKAECKVNLNDMSVAHLPTHSLLMPLSSGSSRSQESKEGLNGSLLIDETHVVDREFIKRVDRTGISRSEPLFLQFSTAGKDPDGYGKEEFDRGVDVNAGRRTDDAYFFAYYGADQTLSDAALADDPAGVIAAANPALGHTIDIEEALADYDRSKDSIRDLADFKTYRLNVWQRSANPWLRADDWMKCFRDFAPQDLYGMPCGAGLDLGKTDDMTALSLLFPEDMAAWLPAANEAREAISGLPQTGHETENLTQSQFLLNLEQPLKLLTWYWIPEEAVERHAVDADYERWARDGWLQVTPGRTIDPNVILGDIKEILKKYQIQMFNYDPWYASGVVGALVDATLLHPDYTWKFVQTITSYAFPSALLERLVISGKLHHDGNPITAWEAGHVQVKEDNNGNIRPVKPLRQNNKKIDGIVATIMGLDAAMRLMSTYSIYEERGILEI
jgi:phage terminase large subunit-like protein